jgi:protein ImuB
VRARVPGLVTQPADPAGDQAALEALCLWCGRYGPAVNTDAPRSLWIDISGVAHLFGGEARLLADLSRRLAAFGLTARLGLASTLAAAWAIARFSGAASLDRRIAPPITPSMTREHAPPAILANLPVAALRLDAAPLLLLRRLGLQRIGQLHALPRAALKRRFPAREAAHAVLNRLDQLLGIAPEPLAALRPPPQHVVRRAFSEPLMALDGMLAALGEATGELCAIFAAHHIGARRLTLTLYRSDGTCIEETAGFSAPTRQPGHLLRLLGDRLERLEDGGTGRDGSHLLGLGVDALVLAATRTQAQGAVQTGLLAAGRDPGVGDSTGSVAPLIDRLANRLGAHRVHRLGARASHIPERAQVLVPALAPAENNPARLQPSQPRGPPRPCLLLSPPEPILVTAEIPEGAPAHFTWRRLARRVVLAEGPERIAPEWWRSLNHDSSQGGARTRDYYRLEDDGGARYWVFRDGLYQEWEEEHAPPRWYVHGLYA